MGLGTPAPDGRRGQYQADYQGVGDAGEYGFGPDDGARPYAVEEAPESGRRTAPLAIKKSSKEADGARPGPGSRSVSGNGSGTASPGLAPGSERYRGDMSRSGSSRSAERDEEGLR